MSGEFIFGCFCAGWFIFCIFFVASASNNVQKKCPERSEFYQRYDYIITLLLVGFIPLIFVSVVKLSIKLINI